MLRRALGVAVVCAEAMTAGGAQAALPSDPLATGWTYDSINLPAAWDLSTGSPSVVIAFVDSGVDATHPDLAGVLVRRNLRSRTPPLRGRDFLRAS